MKAMIFAAGMGTRLRPLTDSIPKALIKVHQRPLLEWVILRLKYYGIRDIIINVHHHAQKIIDFLEINHKFDLNIEVSFENVLLDTGGGLKKASWFFEDSGDFLVHNVDILSDINLKKLINAHRQSDAAATLAIRKRKTSRYLLFDNQFQLCGWRSTKENKTVWVKDPIAKVSEFSFSGIHIISTKLLAQLTDDTIFSIIPEYLRLARQNKIIGFRTDNYNWMDLGRKENFETIDQHFNEEFFSTGNTPGKK